MYCSNRTPKFALPRSKGTSAKFPTKKSVRSSSCCSPLAEKLLRVRGSSRFWGALAGRVCWAHAPATTNSAKHVRNSIGPTRTRQTIVSKLERIILSFDPAPDEKRVVALMPVATPEAQQPQNHLIFLEHFFGERRRKMPTNGR